MPVGLNPLFFALDYFLHPPGWSAGQPWRAFWEKQPLIAPTPLRAPWFAVPPIVHSALGYSTIICVRTQSHQSLKRGFGRRQQYLTASLAERVSGSAAVFNIWSSIPIRQSALAEPCWSLSRLISRIPTWPCDKWNHRCSFPLVRFMDILPLQKAFGRGEPHLGWCSQELLSTRLCLFRTELTPLQGQGLVNEILYSTSCLESPRHCFLATYLKMNLSL